MELTAGIVTDTPHDWEVDVVTLRLAETLLAVMPTLAEIWDDVVVVALHV
jgi:hypothetical protein